MEGRGSPVATSKCLWHLEAPTEPTGETGWLVSWCVGHLAGLAEPAAYDPDYAKWRREDLPILPGSWRFTIGQDKRRQFDVLRTLLHREDVSEVVNACDAGREGELIFRAAYHLAGCTKPMKRLWISSMEDSAIREGFENLRPGSDYDGLHQAALCRQKADWLVGINATRLFSVLYGRTLNIGRVMSPTLAMIAQREAEIAAFEPVPFYTVELDCGGMTVTGERLDGKAEAEAIAAASEGGTATVQASTASMICGVSVPGAVLAAQVCDSGKVSDHHAIVPTASAAGADLSALPVSAASSRREPTLTR